MKKVLITGGAGFIGSNLAEQFIQNGWDVTLLDIKKDPKNIEEFVDKVEYVQMDVRSTDLGEFFREIGPNGIVHLAAVSRVLWCEERQEECLSINVNGTRNVLNSAAKLQDKPWVIFSSSREVYGNQNMFPVKETYNRYPVSVYAKSKCTGEDIIRNYANEKGLMAIILRLSNVYGNERDIPERVIPKFIIRALQGKKITIYGRNKFFDFTFVSDAISAIIKASEKIENFDERTIDVYNICTGKPTRLEELAEMISDKVGISVDVKYMKQQQYEVRHFYGDNTKARKYLCWETRWNIENGLKHTVNRYKRFLEVL